MKQKHYRGKYAAGRKRAPLILWLVPAVLLAISLGAIGRILLIRHNDRVAYQQMAASVRESHETEVQTTAAVETTVYEETIGTTAATTEQVTEPTGPCVQYQRLAKENPDMVGWLRIDGTVIDYPVMHTPQEPEKYLHQNFQGEYSYAGVPFIDYRCKEDSDNLLIYGHNMADGTMFCTLVDYQRKEHWEQHPVICFDSLEEEREYEVVAAFFDRIYYTHETAFKFYNFIDAANEADYNRAVKKLKEKSIYNTGVTPEYGQQLITLVTCTYHVENGRFVVVACEKEQNR